MAGPPGIRAWDLGKATVRYSAMLEEARSGGGAEDWVAKDRVACSGRKRWNHEKHERHEKKKRGARSRELVNREAVLPVSVTEG